MADQQGPTKIPTKITTEVEPVVKRFRTFCTDLLTDMISHKTSPAQARKYFQAYFKDLSQDEQIELYQNNKAAKILTELQQYGTVLYSELPVALSQVNLNLPEEK